MLSVRIAVAGLTVTVTGPVVVATGLLESVAFTVITVVGGTAVVGVPVMTHAAPSVSPAGKVPAVMVQLYGAAPPETPMVPVYGTLTVAAGGLLRVSVGAAGRIVSPTGPVVDSTGLLESVAFTLRMTESATVGVPLTTQLADSVSPAGSVPAVSEQPYGAVPPLTPMVALYGVPTVPFGRLPVVIVSGVGDTVTVTGEVPVFATGVLLSVAFTVIG